jgi:hypothetical protein
MLVRFRILPGNCRDGLKIYAKTCCSGPLCWYFCWYRKAKRAAANFAIPNDGIEQGGPQNDGAGANPKQI